MVLNGFPTHPWYQKVPKSTMVLKVGGLPSYAPIWARALELVGKWGCPEWYLVRLSSQPFVFFLRGWASEKIQTYTFIHISHKFRHCTSIFRQHASIAFYMHMHFLKTKTHIHIYIYTNNISINKLTSCSASIRSPPRSRGSTLRSKSKPLGRKDSKKVCEGNVMTARVMILCILAAARGIWWILEQPCTSIMELHPSFQRTLKVLAPVQRLRIAMSDFGGDSKKPTYLYSSSMAWSVFLFFIPWPNKKSGLVPSHDSHGM